MARLLLIGAVMSFGMLAQAQPLTHQYALDDRVFQSCDDVLHRAVALSTDIRESAYVMELYSQSRGSLDYLFASETKSSESTGWIASHDTKSIPYALFYFIKGAYTLRCRGKDGGYVKLSGPPGGASPLDLEIGSGKAEIWYFSLTPDYRNAFVYIVTDISLNTLSEPDETRLMEHVRELLGARFVQAVYLRNDPWFLGAAPNSLMYLFTDSFKGITLEEYRATKTMWCNQKTGCKFYLIY